MLDQSIFIPHATSQQLYHLLLDSHQHSQLTGNKAEIVPKEGGTFTAYGGYASGRLTHLIPSKLIEQTWRASDWPANHFSKVRFEFKVAPGGTTIHFTQKDLPPGTESEFAGGWQDYYWQPLIEHFAHHP